MHTHAEPNSRDDQSRSVAQPGRAKSRSSAAKGDTADATSHPDKASAPKPHGSANATGLPDGLKQGVEALSGQSLDHVRVHRNSSQPGKLNAHAFAQGGEIHVAPGQDKHLPHEAWHVVQQAQGRVQPTGRAKGVAINSDPRLEREADVMGNRATTHVNAEPVAQRVEAMDDPSGRPATAKIAQLRAKGEAITTAITIVRGQHLTDHKHTDSEIRAQIVAQWGHRTELSDGKFSVSWGEGAPEGIIFWDNGDSVTITHAQSGANKRAGEAAEAKRRADLNRAGGGASSRDWRARPAPPATRPAEEKKT
jgi:hypothetical protein